MKNFECIGALFWFALCAPEDASMEDTNEKKKEKNDHAIKRANHVSKTSLSLLSLTILGLPNLDPLGCQNFGRPRDLGCLNDFNLMEVWEPSLDGPFGEAPETIAKQNKRPTRRLNPEKIVSHTAT